MTNVDAIGGDAGRSFPDTDADVIVVDPPRAGLAPDVVKQLSEQSARAIAYVSCDPATLARMDLRAQPTTDTRGQRRKGPSIFQDYYDIIKLFKRDDVRTESSTFVSRCMPMASTKQTPTYRTGM